MFDRNRSIVGLPVLMVSFFVAWFFQPLTLYIGIDGSLFMNLLRQRAAWGGVFDVTVTNPFQGLVSFHLPMGVWLNPVALPFALSSGTLAKLASYTAALVIHVAAIYALGRFIGFSQIAALVAVQLVMLATFPPTNLWRNFSEQFALNPGVSVVLSLMILIWIALASVSKLSFFSVLARAGLILLLTLYAAYCDAQWLVVLGIAASIHFVALLYSPRDWRAAAAKCLCGALVVMALVSLGAANYLYSLLSGTARQWLQGEIHGEIQTTPLTFFVLNGAFEGVAGIVMLAGCLAAGLWSRHRHQRIIGFASLAYAVILTAASLVFLYSDINWTFPLPYYFNILAVPFLIVGSVAGWPLLAARMLRGPASRWPELAHRIAHASWKGLSAGTGLVWAIPVLALLVLGPRHSTGSILRATAGDEILKTLHDKTALSAGAAFRGSAATLAGFSEPYLKRLNRGLDAPYSKWVSAGVEETYLYEFGHTLALTDLWGADVPTVEEYSQMITPLQYIFASRLLARPGDYQSRNFIRIGMLDSRILEALGVRFLVSDLALSDPRVQRRHSIVGRTGFTTNLYELRAPNLGQFSPTVIHIAANVRDALVRMADPAFDFTAEAIAFDAVPGPLTQASGARMRFRAGAIHVQIETAGRALLLLPVQYSACLRAEGPGQPQLLRLNLFMTGLLVQNGGEIVLENTFGIFSAGCRRIDIRETAAILPATPTFGNDNWVPLPPFQHPRARIHVAAQPRMAGSPPSLSWRVPDLPRAQELLNAGRTAEAHALLDAIIARHPTLSLPQQLRRDSLEPKSTVKTP